MSVNYQVIPVDATVKNQQFLDWLDSWGVTFPQQYVSGRYPTIDEIKMVLNSLENCTGRFSVVGDFPIQQADIFLAEYTTELYFWQASNGEIEHLSFRGGGYDLVSQVAQRFANICGTFLVTIEGEDPTLVFPNQSI